MWVESKYFSYVCLQNAASGSSSSNPQSPTSSTTPAVKKKKPEDFKFGKVLGEGSFSTVSLSETLLKFWASSVCWKNHSYFCIEKNLGL